MPNSPSTPLHNTSHITTLTFFRCINYTTYHTRRRKPGVHSSCSQSYLEHFPISTRDIQTMCSFSHIYMFVWVYAFLLPQLMLCPWCWHFSQTITTAQDMWLVCWGRTSSFKPQTNWLYARLGMFQAKSHTNTQTQLHRDSTSFSRSGLYLFRRQLCNNIET